MELLADGMTERLATAAQAVPALRPYAAGLRTAFEALADLASEGRTWTAQRIHAGDLHLGQCLRALRGVVAHRLRGRALKPLAERRMPGRPCGHSGDAPLLRLRGPRRPGALGSARAGAAPQSGGARLGRSMLPGRVLRRIAEVAGRDPRADPVLLRAYETDKAIYEVLYEARRADWLPVPMAAIRRLAASP